MLLALHSLIPSLPSNTTLIDHVLPKAVSTFGQEFIYWVDGGAGIGETSKNYSKIVGDEINARIYCYEPLPENYQVLLKNLGQNERYVLHNVAISNMQGEAKFQVPKRMTGDGVGDWTAGTSWDGSLKWGTGHEEIEVRTVCLEDEDIPRFDYIKLDLQGGELDALIGMGDRIREAKILYVETMLHQNWDNCLDYLHGHGFVTFYDRLQLGLKAGLRSIPLEELREHGIVIDQIGLPHSAGMFLTCWGYFESAKGILDETSHILPKATSDQLLEIGVRYIQTDTIALNSRHWPQMATLFS